MRLKKGFTLAEILVAVGIIGVMAALMATAFNGAKPDRTKLLYLKAYDALTEIVTNAVNNTELYSETYTAGGTDYDVSEYPILDFSVPRASNLLNSTNTASLVPSGRMKFANLLLQMLNGEVTAGCLSNSTECEFDSNPGGYHWTVRPHTNISNVLTAFPASGFWYYEQVVVNIEGEDFEFFVHPDGDIDIVGAKGATFVRNRQNLRSRNETAAYTSDFVNTYDSSKHLLQVNNGKVVPQ